MGKGDNTSSILYISNFNILFTCGVKLIERGNALYVGVLHVSWDTTNSGANSCKEPPGQQNTSSSNSSYALQYVGQ